MRESRKNCLVVSPRRVCGRRNVETKGGGMWVGTSTIFFFYISLFHKTQGIKLSGAIHIEDYFVLHVTQTNRSIGGRAGALAAYGLGGVY